jgi:hypothetical protein
VAMVVIGRPPGCHVCYDTCAPFAYYPCLRHPSACREAAAAQAEAAQQLVAASARSGRDAEKAAGVRAQQRLWGAALELRIRLQKALAGGNSLPRPAARAALAGHNQQVARRCAAGSRGGSRHVAGCQAGVHRCW